jgi:hypothetical protein
MTLPTTVSQTKAITLTGSPSSGLQGKHGRNDRMNNLLTWEHDLREYEKSLKNKEQKLNEKDLRQLELANQYSACKALNIRLENSITEMREENNLLRTKLLLETNRKLDSSSSSYRTDFGDVNANNVTNSKINDSGTSQPGCCMNSQATQHGSSVSQSDVLALKIQMVDMENRCWLSDNRLWMFTST